MDNHCVYVYGCVASTYVGLYCMYYAYYVCRLGMAVHVAVLYILHIRKFFMQTYIHIYMAIWCFQAENKTRIFWKFAFLYSLSIRSFSFASTYKWTNIVEKICISFLLTTYPIATERLSCIDKGSISLPSIQTHRLPSKGCVNVYKCERNYMQI